MQKNRALRCRFDTLCDSPRYVQLIVAVLFSTATRIAFLFTTAGVDVAPGVYEAGRKWISTGHYVPSRAPGSPVYEGFLGILSLLSRNSLKPYFYLTNCASALLSGLTLWMLFDLLRRFTSTCSALAVAVVFSFFPLWWVMGGATSDLVFMMLFGVAAVWAFFGNHRWLSILFAVLCVGSRIQGLAFAAPVAAAILYLDWRHHKRRCAYQLAVLAAGICLVYWPVWIWQGVSGFKTQPYHHGLYSRTKIIGAWIYRSLNFLGPLGMLMVAAKLFTLRRSTLKTKPSRLLAIFAFGVSNITLFFMWVAPWENFYLMPVAPIAISFFLCFKPNRYASAVFVLSVLSANVAQIQLKLWKWPPLRIQESIPSAHLREGWLVRSGG